MHTYIHDIHTDRLLIAGLQILEWTRVIVGTGQAGRVGADGGISGYHHRRLGISPLDFAFNLL